MFNNFNRSSSYNNYNEFINNERVDMKVVKTFFIDLLTYNSEINYLEVIIKLKTRKPKITKYIIVKKTNLWDYSVREKLIKRISKNINPTLFVNEQIRKLDLSK